MNANEFVAALEALRPKFTSSGRILIGTQQADSTFPGVVPYGEEVPENATHLNTGLFRPEENRRWYERGHLVNNTLGLVLDDQGNPDKAEVAPSLPPTAKVWTSEGSEQWLYMYSEPVPPIKGKAMALGAVLAGMSDEFISNRHHHWWRLPGSLPKPKIKQGRTHPARLIEWTGITYRYVKLASGLGIEPKEGSIGQYRGSIKFDQDSATDDPLYQWMDRNGHTEGGYSGFDSRGFRNVMCPNHEQHGDPNRPWGRYVPPNIESSPGFTCHHAHCNGVNGPKVTLDDLRKWVEGEGGPSVATSKAYSSKMWRRQQADLYVKRAEEWSRLNPVLLKALEGMKNGR